MQLARISTTPNIYDQVGLGGAGEDAFPTGFQVMLVQETL